MKKAESHGKVISEHITFSGKTVIDVGCGTGDFVRWMTSQGAVVFGVDIPEMIYKAEKYQKAGDEKYLAGTGETLLFEKQFADIIIYIASFHHIPEAEMITAFQRCHSVLKPGGAAVFVEPVAQKGSYYEIVRLENDEAEIQTRAYRIMLDAEKYGFKMINEQYYFLERSFADYLTLIETFVSDEARKTQIIADARKVTEILCREEKVNFEHFRYKSICRLNILVKSIP